MQKIIGSKDGFILVNGTERETTELRGGCPISFCFGDSFLSTPVPRNDFTLNPALGHSSAILRIGIRV